MMILRSFFKVVHLPANLVWVCFIAWGLQSAVLANPMATTPGTVPGLPAAAMISPAQMEFLKTEVKKDFSEHLFDRIIPSLSKKMADRLLGEPMSATSQEIIISAAYQIASREAMLVGIRISEPDFRHALSTILNWTSRFGLFPQSIVLGMVGKAQYGVGGAVGMEFNFYFRDGMLRMASYRTFGVSVGLMTPQVQGRIDFYSALCFGSCTGDDAEGWYFGLEGAYDFGAGGNFYIEGGVDFTGLTPQSILDPEKVIAQLYDTKNIMVGYASSFGFIKGISANAYYYELIQDRMIARPGSKPSPKTLSKIKF